VISLTRPSSGFAVMGMNQLDWSPMHRKADVKDRPFLVIMLMLVLLLLVALWQFYSLVWR
jgi:hypothetical protein